jgi:hypothetical protein
MQMEPLGVAAPSESDEQLRRVVGAVTIDDPEVSLATGRYVDGRRDKTGCATDRLNGIASVHGAVVPSRAAYVTQSGSHLVSRRALQEASTR